MMKQTANLIMPVAFIGHGNPMNAIQHNKFGQTWKKLGQILPKPKAIVCISAHWQTNGIFVTAMQKPKTIHDFGGFPKQLFDVQYPAPGNPQLAAQIASNLKNFKVQLDQDNWGLDHGTWSILVHMYPKADIPVLQLSINNQFTMQQHYQFAGHLNWLRKQGVLIMGSGNIVHHLGLLDWDNEDAGHPWATLVRNKTNQYLKNGEHDKLVNYKQNGPQFIKAINSKQHYIPLMYAIGLQQQGDEVSLFNDAMNMGSLSMTSVLISSKGDQIHTKLKQIVKNN